MDSAIRISGLSKVYSDGWGRSKVVALEDISLDLKKGEALSVFGGNGSGKSTLLKLLAGLSGGHRGSVEVFGLVPLAAVRNNLVGFLPERVTYPGHFSATGYLSFLAQLGGGTSEEQRCRVETCVARCHLENEQNKLIRKLSKGMLQRLALAQALIHDPHLVVLDEPLDGMDPLAREHFCLLMKELKAAGKTLVISTHISECIEVLCDQAVVLHEGRSLFSGPATFENGVQEWILKRLKKVEVSIA